MTLVLIRHAIAEERDSSKWPDDALRPLTANGKKRFHEAARGIGAAVPQVDRLFSSPFTRAWQTAEVLHGESAWPEPEKLAALAAGNAPHQVLHELRALPGGRYALVGHEPDLSGLIALLCFGSVRSGAVTMKKGSAALVEVRAEVAAPGSGTVRWLLDPKTARLVRP